MSGIEFLKRVKERSPNTMGIIMTTFVESEAAINAIRCGYVCQFVKKPLDSKRVKQAVAMAINSYEIEVESQKLLKPTMQSPQHLFSRAISLSKHLFIMTNYPEL
ncbi:MAG: hypothetical protein HQ552_07820 [Desulfobacteraceae bacterium]|nr:hypothetical protein [Desulfobacteraceae bacterium]